MSETRVRYRPGDEVTAVCPCCGREGQIRFYGDVFESLQTGYEEWACASWCGESTRRPFVVDTGNPHGARRYRDDV